MCPTGNKGDSRYLQTMLGGKTKAGAFASAFVVTPERLELSTQ